MRANRALRPRTAADATSHGWIPSVSPAAPYNRTMHTVTLPPELARFAEKAVAAGRFADVSAVVAARVSLLQRQEQACAELLSSVLAARDESERRLPHRR